ncbi:FAD/NAD(P)-binding domain-containing protein [Hypoxylon crocopeplum]|nr:FAD/NAD(P)-binding domain-containing protein [Hypoxylon crocopeplum]
MPPPLTIAIIGAGVGGPAAAIGLARNGHTVTLYERAPSIGGVGFAFRITPNADRCLKFLGIDAVAGGAVVANWSRFMDSRGKVLREIRENAGPGGGGGGLSIFAYRLSLQKQLLDEAARHGAQIRMGVEVTSVDVSSCTIEFADGTTSTVDLIIGADGVHSCIRPHVIDGSIHFPRASTGHSCLRATISKQDILDDPMASHVINDEFPLVGWRNAEKVIVCYVVDNGRQANMVCTHPEALSSRETSSGDDADKTGYNQRITLDAARDIYQDFDPVAVRLLELADPDGFRVWKLMDMDNIPRWSAGNVVLLGDACHPVLPYGFSGASMAIEDAVTLTALLPSDVELAQIQDRLQLYERIRKPRVQRVRDESRTWSSGVRDAEGWKRYIGFLNSHDAVKYAEQELKKHQGS